MSTAKYRLTFFSLCLFMNYMLASITVAQSPERVQNGEEEQSLVERWYKAYDAIVASIQVDQLHSETGVDTSSNSVELKRQTILTISNPSFHGRHGRVYLWTDEGRPVVLSAIMSTLDAKGSGRRHVTYEFNSLSQDSVTAGRNEVVYWNCLEPGIEWHEDLEESQPSSNRMARLAQMRAIAREIEAKKLRLMTTPVYRYPNETPEITDGAIFAFSNGTDPGIFLLIEAKQNKWYLACSRSNVGPISVMKGPKIIDSFNYGPNQDVFQKGPWYQKYTAELRPGNDPDTILVEAWTNQKN